MHALDLADRRSPRRIVPEIAGEHAAAKPRIMVRVAQRAGVAIAFALAISFAVTGLLRAVAP